VDVEAVWVYGSYTNDPANTGKTAAPLFIVYIYEVTTHGTPDLNGGLESTALCWDLGDYGL